MNNLKTENQMRALLREQEQSELIVEEYAERNGLAAGQLYDYRQPIKAKPKRVLNLIRASIEQKAYNAGATQWQSGNVCQKGESL